MARSWPDSERRGRRAGSPLGPVRGRGAWRPWAGRGGLDTCANRGHGADAWMGACRAWGGSCAGRGGVTVRVESWQARPGMDASGPGLGLGRAGSIAKSSLSKGRAAAGPGGCRVSRLSRLPSAAEMGLAAELEALRLDPGLARGLKTRQVDFITDSVKFRSSCPRTRPDSDHEKAPAAIHDSESLLRQSGRALITPESPGPGLGCWAQGLRLSLNPTRIRHHHDSDARARGDDHYADSDSGTRTSGGGPACHAGGGGPTLPLEIAHRGRHIPTGRRSGL